MAGATDQPNYTPEEARELIKAATVNFLSFVIGQSLAAGFTVNDICQLVRDIDESMKEPTPAVAAYLAQVNKLYQ